MPAEPGSLTSPITAELLRSLGLTFARQPVELHARLAATLTGRARDAQLGRVYVALSSVVDVLEDRLEDIGPETLLELALDEPAAPPQLLEPESVLEVLEVLDEAQQPNGPVPTWALDGDDLPDDVLERDLEAVAQFEEIEA